MFVCVGNEISDIMVEREPQLLPEGISLYNLRKRYKGDNKNFAVDGLTVKFFESQVTAFLGHNGAGKTTTMYVIRQMFALLVTKSILFTFQTKFIIFFLNLHALKTVFIK